MLFLQLSIENQVCYSGVDLLFSNAAIKYSAIRTEHVEANRCPFIMVLKITILWLYLARLQPKCHKVGVKRKSSKQLHMFLKKYKNLIKFNIVVILKPVSFHFSIFGTEILCFKMKHNNCFQNFWSIWHIFLIIHK